jgi:hypothetical protein
MKRLLPALTIALLALPAPALAKEVQALTVCGTNGCHTTRDKSALRDELGFETQPAPSHRGAFYRVRMRIGEPGRHDVGTFRPQWIPSLRLIRVDEGPTIDYGAVRPSTERLLTRLSSGLKPFPAAKLGPLGGAPQAAQVDEVVLPPSSSSRDGGSDGGDSGWAWSLLAIAPAGLAFWLLRRRRGRPSLA